MPKSPGSKTQKVKPTPAESKISVPNSDDLTAETLKHWSQVFLFLRQQTIKPFLAADSL